MKTNECCANTVSFATYKITVLGYLKCLASHSRLWNEAQVKRNVSKNKPGSPDVC